MSDAPKTSISAKIPSQLHEKLIEAVNDMKFTDKTDCITQALEKTLCNTHQHPSFLESLIQEKDNEILELQHVIQELETPLKLAEANARLEVLQLLVIEKTRG